MATAGCLQAMPQVFSTRSSAAAFFLAVFSGEKCADALNEVLKHPRKSKRLFGRYERSVNRAMDVYLRFVNAWYTKEFIEVFLAPRNVLGLAPAVNAVLGGNVGNSFQIRWRMWVFYSLVWLQRRYPVAPKLTLVPRKEGAPALIETVRTAP
jgi:hypothetical protein